MVQVSEPDDPRIREEMGLKTRCWCGKAFHTADAYYGHLAHHDDPAEYPFTY